ncbi:MAG: hypothetical protein ACRYGP_14535 [Janthinobacterium lividum]
MGGSAATTAQDQGSRPYSAKAEIDDFMRRFLTFAKSDNAVARTTPKVVLRDGILDSADLKGALEKLDTLCSRLDVEATNVIQIEIQNEALRSLHQDRMRRHAETLKELADLRLALESRCSDLEVRLRAATAGRNGRGLGGAKVSRMTQREKRITRRRTCRPKVRTDRKSCPGLDLGAAE